MLDTAAPRRSDHAARELGRQQHQIELRASGSLFFRDAPLAQSSDLTGKCAEGISGGASRGFGEPGLARVGQLVLAGVRRRTDAHPIHAG